MSNEGRKIIHSSPSLSLRERIAVQSTLHNLIGEAATASNHAIATIASRWKWTQLAEMSDRFAQQCANLRASRVAVVHRGDGPSWSALAAFDLLAADVFLLSPSLAHEDCERLCEKFQLSAVASANGTDNITLQTFPSAAAGSGQSSVTILTSGTTGEPKAVRHSWASLCRPIRRSTSAKAPVWLQTYRPNLYAGLQVALQCLANAGTLVSPEVDAEVDPIVELMLREQVGFASATPSYWRRLLIFGDAAKLRAVPLQQITLGGEVVDQSVLDMLRAVFPSARIVHIYATSELGRCFSVTDKLAGFPVNFTGTESPDGVELKVEADELFVRSANAMLGYDCSDSKPTQLNDWFATGDLVRREGERYVFVGRKSDLINVGGNKVSPQEIEPILRSVAGVADVRVYGKRSSLVGQLVAAQIVAADPEQADEVRARVAETCLQRLTAHQRPRLIEMVSRIELSEAGKMVRR